MTTDSSLRRNDKGWNADPEWLDGTSAALSKRTSQRGAIVPDQEKSYDDENLTEEEKDGGRLRQPNQAEEQPYPGKENRADKNFERPDEFGDGDRRS